MKVVECCICSKWLGRSKKRANFSLFQNGRAAIAQLHHRCAIEEWRANPHAFRRSLDVNIWQAFRPSSGQLAARAWSPMESSWQHLGWSRGRCILLTDVASRSFLLAGRRDTWSVQITESVP